MNNTVEHVAGDLHIGCYGGTAVGVVDAHAVLALAGLLDHIQAEGLDDVLVACEVKFSRFAGDGGADDESAVHGFGGIVGRIFNEVHEPVGVTVEVLSLAEAEGNREEAQAILDEPDFVPMPTVKAEIPKVDNRLFRKVWKFRIVDEGQIPRQYMTPDMVKIGGVVRAMKGVTNIPGIQVYEE